MAPCGERVSGWVGAPSMRGGWTGACAACGCSQRRTVTCRTAGGLVAGCAADAGIGILGTNRRPISAKAAGGGGACGGAGAARTPPVYARV